MGQMNYTFALISILALIGPLSFVSASKELENKIEIEKELWMAKQNILKDLIHIDKRRRYLKFHPQKAPPLQLNFQDFPPFKAVLKKGAILRKIYPRNSKEKEGFKILGSPVVWATEEYPGSQFVIVLKKRDDPKKGSIFEPQYKTLSENLTDITEDLILYPQFNPKIIYHPEKKITHVDSKFDFEFNLLYQINYLSSEYFQEIYSDTNSRANASNVDFKLFYRSRFPLQVGILMGGQSGEYLFNNESYILKWDNFYIGGISKLIFYRGDVFDFNIQAGLDHIWRFHALSLNEEYIFSGISWQAEIEAVFKTIVGQFLFGIGYKSTQMSLKETSNDAYLISSQKRSMNGIHISFGLRLDFSL